MTFLITGAVNKDKKQKKILQTILVLIFWEFFMFYQILLLAKGKGSVMTSNKYGI